jgi:hypothetical protein
MLSDPERCTCNGEYPNPVSAITTITMTIVSLINKRRRVVIGSSDLLE